MACSKGCSGTPLCEALGLCCAQFQHDCGKDCNGLPVGYSTIQFDDQGNLEVCSNVGGVCECNTVAAGVGVDTLVLNGDGTFTHTSVAGIPVEVDVCALLKEAMEAGANWQPLGLDPGWANETGMQPLEFRCLCTGEVQLRGCIEGTPTNGELPSQIGIVPINNFVYACRPTLPVRFSGVGCTAIEIDENGVVTTNPNTVPNYRCFDGMSYWVE